MEEELKSVSLIIPVYNEEKYIEGFIDSILKQDYDFGMVELIFIDGNSKDNTKKLILKKLHDSNISFKILDNEKSITPVSLNIGIKESKGDIIIRLDAHSKYPINYITKCVYYINHVDADNVGCIIETESEGKVGNAIASVLSSKFGVGDSKFRTNAKSGYVDTVPFGTFRRTLFDKIGYFDERLPRNQDSEFNHRIIKNGGKIYLFDDIRITYYPRNTIKKLVKMAILNGKWNLFTSYLAPGSMKLRHFVPFIFVLSLIFGIAILFTKCTVLKLLFMLELILYFALDILFSLKNIKKRGLSEPLLCFVIYPIFHITYGLGTLMGIFLIIKNKLKGEKNEKRITIKN